MADLHEALKLLAPTDYADVPQDGLPQYITDCFRAGELICNSVPPPPNGTPFAASKPAETIPNAAKSHKDMVASSARPYPPDAAHEELQKDWGKPMKYSHKDNPLNVALYKTAGHDRHGAWFARRSVHEGLGFSKFKAAMQREFPEALTVEGGPGAGNIRGIGADRRIEHQEVDGVGTVEVYELSSSFPGPTTPRDFLTLFITSEDALTEKSGAELKAGVKHVPRHFMVVSKPVKHPDAPPRSGLIRGQYESVELIREIPLHAAKNVTQSTPNLLHDAESGTVKTRQRGSTVASDPQDDRTVNKTDVVLADEQGDPELNPVEWIMVTRSDPGGGIPRFLVERGTPGQMLVDLHKFLDWACAKDKILKPEEDDELQRAASEAHASREAKDTNDGILPNGRASQSEPALHDTSTAQGGFLASVGNYLGAGIDALAPAAVSNAMHHYTDQRSLDEVSDDSSDTSSIRSFISATEMQRMATANAAMVGKQSMDSLDTIPSRASSSEVQHIASERKLNQHEKEVVKLAHQRTKLEDKLAKKRQHEEQKLKDAQEKESAEQDKAKERYEAQLKKSEERHRKEVEKLERKKEREARKAEEKLRKKNDRDNLSRVARERDDFRDQVDLLRKENDALRSHVGELQRENTAMATRLGKLGPGGAEALRSVKGDIENRSRSSSMKSLDRKAIGSRESSKSREVKHLG
ncbi:hypothetical protein K431DRAFT_284602 [Polychaeton citri CBS 116435]|uniref:DUF3074 domain-containing protein n=1 Tax=Polychaeton citri CBS 116435 TaxID=1314669 RepID=A0A9P4Q903_9PEZI|nr:hypothetical protein K431DRAFT_284602 [Polychaeton citri CBS 116435]